MKIALLLLLSLGSIPVLSQTSEIPVSATLKGNCDIANIGSDNTLTIKCGIGEEQGKKMVEILNKILANQIDSKAVMEKLDEILGAVNPNRGVTTYDCNGRSRYSGPPPSGGIGEMTSVNGDAKTREFKQMLDLTNGHNYPELLKVCEREINTTPEWLTPLLFCSLANYVLNDTDRAVSLLREFDSRTGPAYGAGVCQELSQDLHQQLSK